MGICFPGGRRKETTETNKFNAGSNNVMGNCAKAGFSPSFPGIIGLNNNSKRKVLNGETLLRLRPYVKMFSEGVLTWYKFNKGSFALVPQSRNREESSGGQTEAQNLWCKVKHSLCKLSLLHQSL